MPERKIYTSFHDIPPRDYMYFPKGSLENGNPGRFSRVEVTHLLISMAVLTIAFAFAVSNNQLLLGSGSYDKLPMALVMSFLGILTAFFFHELSHKFMAQRYGLWSEYRMFPTGLLFALFLGVVVGFIFAAPGAVMFRGGSRNFETGKIASAGPLANIFLAIISYPLYRLVFYDDIFLGKIIGSICLINAFLASFNLLPIEPLDGIKIISWNATSWIILFIVSIFLTAAIFPYINEIAFFY